MSSKKLPSSGLISIGASLLLVSGLWSPALSANSAQGAFASDTENQKLVSLEDRIFDHAYSDDNLDDRLSRLEKTVYGQTRNGSDDDRLSYLLSTVPAHKKAAQQLASNSGSFGGPRGNGSTASPNYWQSQYQSRNNPTPAPINYPAQPASNSYNYEQSASSSTVPQSSNSYDSPQSNGTSAYSPTPTASASSSNDRNGNMGLGQSVALLEQQTMGEAHSSQPLPMRLTQLESAVFGPTADHSGSLYDRIARLNTVVGAGNDPTCGGMANTPRPDYKQASAYKAGAMPVIKQNNGHPLLKNVAKTAVVLGVVAGATALTIMAVKGMKGGHHGFDRD